MGEFAVVMGHLGIFTETDDSGELRLTSPLGLQYVVLG